MPYTRKGMSLPGDLGCALPFLVGTLCREPRPRTGGATAKGLGHDRINEVVILFIGCLRLEHKFTVAAPKAVMHLSDASSSMNFDHRAVA